MEKRRRLPEWSLWALLAACLCLFPNCQTDEVLPREEKYVTVRLNDSLKRYDSVEIVILAEGDSGKVVGKVWTGPLANPGSVPSYRIPDSEERDLSVRVRGYDSAGNLALNLLISKQRDGTQVVANLPIPVTANTGNPVDTVKAFPQGYDDWRYRGLVIVNLKTLNLNREWAETGMPLLLRLTRLNFDFTQAGSDGRDIRFTKLDGTPVPYEIARWEPADNRAEIWFRADSLRVKDDSVRFRMYWGNSIAKPESAGDKVFGIGDRHTAVYHLAEQGKGDAMEYREAGGRYHGQGGSGGGAGVPKRVDGVVDYAQDFHPVADGIAVPVVGTIPGKKYQASISLPRDLDPGMHAWTFQAWVKRAGITSDASLFNKGDEWTAGKQRFQLVSYKNTGKLAVSREGATGETDVPIPPFQFIHLGVAYTGARFEVFLDGFSRFSMAWSQGGEPVGSAVLGATETGEDFEGFDGLMDEVWMASAARSPMWMRLSFENQRQGSVIVGLRR